MQTLGSNILIDVSLNQWFPFLHAFNFLCVVKVRYSILIQQSITG